MNRIMAKIEWCELRAPHPTMISKPSGLTSPYAEIAGKYHGSFCMMREPMQIRDNCDRDLNIWMEVPYVYFPTDSDLALFKLSCPV
jgi:hypothetical protein